MGLAPFKSKRTPDSMLLKGPPDVNDANDHDGGDDDDDGIAILHGEASDEGKNRKKESNSKEIPSIYFVCSLCD